MSMTFKATEQSVHEPLSSAEDLFSMRTIFRTLWKQLWLIVLVTVAVTGAAVGISFQATPQYQASIKILVGQNDRVVVSPSETINLQSLNLTMVEAIDSLTIAEDVVRELNLKLPPEEVFANMSAEGIEGTQFIYVSYTDPNPKRAQRVANTIGTVVARRIEEAGSGNSPLTISVWERAQLPGAPVSPNPISRGLVAFLLGSMLGVGLAFLREYLDDRWQSPEEVEQVSGLPNLGVIPQFEISEGRKRMEKQEA
jgi:capsular polysaccharide biosynthesis protein